MYYNTCMSKIKSPGVAGIFYPAGAGELNKYIDHFKYNSKNYYEYKTRAVIVPHAGINYSGQLAYNGLKLLNPNLQTLFIFAPAHHVPFQNLCIASYSEWETPFGNIKVNQRINKELNDRFYIGCYNEAFEDEHSIEIQLPFIKSIFEDVSIVPVLVGKSDTNAILKLIKHYWDDKNIGFVISSDLSHFLKDKDAQKLDLLTAEMVEKGDITQFNYKQACGSFGICALTEFASEQKFSLIRNGLMNSSATTGDTSRVVGYGSWFLYEGSTNEFLKKYYSGKILRICREVILGELNRTNYGNLTHLHLPPVFEERIACFVTLEKDDQLRGCIGSILAHRTLKEDLIANAKAAAFRDPRFRPLERSEFEKLSIAVSLLSQPESISFASEKDLLEQIEPFKDGLIIKDDVYQAVYLPSVWEQLPDKKDFLSSLKVKAGLSADYFSNTFEAFKFNSEYIK